MADNKVSKLNGPEMPLSGRAWGSSTFETSGYSVDAALYEGPRHSYPL